MTRTSVPRIVIRQHYEALRTSGQLGRVNVVRTIATGIGYTLDKNGNHSFVRKVLHELALPC